MNVCINKSLSLSIYLYIYTYIMLNYIYNKKTSESTKKRLPLKSEPRSSQGSIFAALEGLGVLVGAAEPWGLGEAFRGFSGFQGLSFSFFCLGV